MHREAWNFCSPWDSKELDRTEGLNWTKLYEWVERGLVGEHSRVLPKFLLSINHDESYGNIFTRDKFCLDVWEGELERVEVWVDFHSLWQTHRQNLHQTDSSREGFGRAVWLTDSQSVASKSSEPRPRLPSVVLEDVYLWFFCRLISKDVLFSCVSLKLPFTFMSTWSRYLSTPSSCHSATAFSLQLCAPAGEALAEQAAYLPFLLNSCEVLGPEIQLTVYKCGLKHHWELSKVSFIWPLLVVCFPLLWLVTKYLMKEIQEKNFVTNKLSYSHLWALYRCYNKYFGFIFLFSFCMCM